jgi:hypothetical protein
MSKKLNKLINYFHEEGRTDDYVHEQVSNAIVNVFDYIKPDAFGLTDDEWEDILNDDDKRYQLEEAYIEGFCKAEGYGNKNK